MIWKSLAVTATVVAATFASAAPAYASSRLDYGDAARGYFESGAENETFFACDIKTDGYGARVDWYVGGSTYSGSVSDTDGNNGNCSAQYVNIVENKPVYYRVCLLSNGTTYSCSQYIGDVA